MNEKKQIEHFNQVKGLLDDLDNDSQLLIIWSYLSNLIETEPRFLTWVLEQLEKVIDRESNKLIL